MDLKDLNIPPQKGAQFKKKGILSVEDLVGYLPRKYNDLSRETGILPETELSCFRMRTHDIIVSDHSRVPYVRILGTVEDTGERVSVTWFRQNFLYKKFYPFMGRIFYVAGKVTYSAEYGNYSICGPELFELLTSDVKRIWPVYSKIPGMSSAYLTEKIESAFSYPSATSETLTFDILSKYKIPSRREALYYLHHPLSQDQIALGQKRLVFEDLLYFALHNEWAQRASVPGSPFNIITLGIYEKFKAGLPYSLTADQQAAVDTMLAHVRVGKRVNALVQGDVGCGKTIVAFLMMAAMASNGYQSVLMAPTQVLARQHYEELSEMMAPYGLKTVYLGSELKVKERKAILAMIESGEANFIVGTHSVVGKDVRYHKLALTIADEEHRFGVAQRAALVKKAEDGVHSITMSATPIPRTLANVIYGSGVQLCDIKQMPAGRQPVITGIATSKAKLFGFILREKRLGHQTYVVCPLIDPSDTLAGVRSVEEVFNEYNSVLQPRGVRIDVLTGRTSKTDTEEKIRRFKDGELDVLISTTVIEVGVNVPTATLIVISNAERFGLASLHQLRGRVGRSDLQSFCVLDSADQTEKGQQRLQVMCNENDGFKIAEADLRLRGAGDFIGTRQSGDNRYMALMMAYPEVYEQAKMLAKEMLDSGTDCALFRRVRADREQRA